MMYYLIKIHNLVFFYLYNFGVAWGKESTFVSGIFVFIQLATFPLREFSLMVANHPKDQNPTD